MKRGTIFLVVGAVVLFFLFRKFGKTSDPYANSAGGNIAL
jgi:hypothetical protein